MQTDRPNKRVHRITPKGLEHLHHWSSESAKPPAVKDDMMVRFYALDHIDLEAIRWQIKERKRQHEERLHTYQFIMAKRFDQLDALDKKQIGKRLGLKLGIRYESNWIEWCDEALSELSGLK